MTNLKYPVRPEEPAEDAPEAIQRAWQAAMVRYYLDMSQVHLLQLRFMCGDTVEVPKKGTCT